MPSTLATGVFAPMYPRMSDSEPSDRTSGVFAPMYPRMSASEPSDRTSGEQCNGRRFESGVASNGHYVISLF